MPQADRQRLLIKVFTVGLLAVSVIVLSYKTPNATDGVFARQAPAQAPVISVANQAGVPLRISAVNFDGSKQEAVSFSVTNVSEKPISAYAIRQDVAAGESSDSSVLLLDLGLVNSTLPPQQSATRADTFRPPAGGLTTCRFRWTMSNSPTGRGGAAIRLNPRNKSRGNAPAHALPPTGCSKS